MSVNFQSIVVLLLFIAPGFLYSRAYLNARPRYHRVPDLFQQTVLAVVGSTLIHTCMITLIAFVVYLCTTIIGNKLAFKDLFPVKFIDLTLRSITIYSFIITIYITASMMIANRLGAWLGQLHPDRSSFLQRFLKGSYPAEPIMLWYSTLVEEPLRHGITSPRLTVWLRSGERFEGNLVEFRLSADEINVIELALEDVIFQPDQFVSPKQSSKYISKPISLSNHRVMLKSTDILWLSRVDIS